MSNNNIQRRGLMLVLSSPSGAGKTTLSRRLLESDGNIQLSVSATTRPMRPGETHGKDYHFLSMEEFDAWLPSLYGKLSGDDLLILTADHGCDPTTASTDHSREYVPVLAYRPRKPQGVNLGLRSTLSDIGQTVAENFGTTISQGTSFLGAIM